MFERLSFRFLLLIDQPLSVPYPYLTLIPTLPLPVPLPYPYFYPYPYLTLTLTLTLVYSASMHISSTTRRALPSVHALLRCLVLEQASGMGAAGGARLTAGAIIRRTLREHGVRGLYRGYWPTLSRNIPSAIIRFSLYEEMKL